MAASVTPTTVRAAAAPRLEYLGALGLFAVAALVAFWNVGAANVHVDERVYIDAGWEYVHGNFAPNVEHPPMGKYLFGIAQLIGGQGELAPRVLVGALILLTGAATWWWLRAEIGGLAALVPTALWLLTPRGVPGSILRIDRLALLDPVMTCFVALSLIAAWRYYRSHRLVWSLLAGVFLALAGATKVSAAAAVAGIILLIALPPRRVRALAWFAGVAVATACLVYWPAGFLNAIADMIVFQGTHNGAGHIIDVAGMQTTTPPWWANLWFTLHGMGFLTAIALGFGIVAAWLSGRHTMLVTALTVTMVGFIAFHILVMHVALPHYFEAWTWSGAVLAGLGLVTVFQMPRESDRRFARVAGAMVSVALVLSCGTTVVDSLTDRARGIALVPAILQADPAPDGDALVAGEPSYVAKPYFGEDAVSSIDEIPTENVRAIIIGTDDRYPVDPRLELFLAVPDPRIRVTHADDQTIYILDGQLVLSNDRLALAQQ